MSFPKIFIDAYDCVTPAGQGVAAILMSLFEGRTHLQTALAKGIASNHLTSAAASGESARVMSRGVLPSAIESHLHTLELEKSLKNQDKIGLIAVHIARSIAKREVFFQKRTAGIILGSSRGPTQSLEKFWRSFSEGERLHPSTSPTTTASSLSSLVARDLQLNGPSFTLSAACSTGLYALLQGIGNLLSGMAETMLVGGVEAANTDFTFQMLHAAKVLSASSVSEEYPCRPGHPARSGMVLSEGGSLLNLSLLRNEASNAEILGWGAATEGGTLTGVSEDGEALTEAIRKALGIAQIDASEVDFIVGHGSGTQRGDASELAAYHSIFSDLPPLVWHKWCSGHMLGASAALSVILAIAHLKSGQLPPHPYLDEDSPMRHAVHLPSAKIALVTSMGFGGSACALLVKRL